MKPKLIEPKQRAKPVGIWIRVSTEDQTKGESPEHHEKRYRTCAESRGWRVREVCHLEAVSGKSTMAHLETRRALGRRTDEERFPLVSSMKLASGLCPRAGVMCVPDARRGRMVCRTLVSLLVAATVEVATSGAAHAALHPGLPVEWRLFETRSVLRDSAAIARRGRVHVWSIEAGLSRLSEGLTLGRGSPEVRVGRPGSRVGGEFNHGLWHAGLDAIDDAVAVMREDAFPVAAYADESVPGLRSTLRGALGLGSSGVEGGEATLELDGPALDVHASRADLRPNVVGWVRVRGRRGQPHASVMPALSVALTHLPIFASSLPLAFTATSEWAGGVLPRSRLLAQLGWQGEGHAFGGGSSDAPGGPTWSPWVAIGYGAPLDRRTSARFAATAAIIVVLVKG